MCGVARTWLTALPAAEDAWPHLWRLWVDKGIEHAEAHANHPDTCGYRPRPTNHRRNQS